MNLLLDTHAFLWFADGSEKLSDQAQAAITNEDNCVFVSVVSLWEIQIKVRLGKLRLGVPLPDLVDTQQVENGLSMLPVLPGHTYRLNELPDVHRDPFDRLLIAQAMVESCQLVSKDRLIHAYQGCVNVLW